MDNLMTIFTPTYNRKETLEKCYESLLSQKNKNFIWQIIDDGSTDGTENYVRQWMDQKLICIKYKKKENGGKVSAINLSLEITDTALWMCLDSDDYLAKDAVNSIIDNYETIKKNDKVCGMFALRSGENGKPMQRKNIPENIKYTTQKYVRYILNIPPEYVHIYKTEIIKEYPYPIIPGEKYFPLSFVFDQIDEKYNYLVLQNNLMICEYRNDGMTKNKRKLIKDNPKGYMLYKRQAIKLAPNLKTRIKACITYSTACLLSKQRRGIRKSSHKVLTLLCFPLGVIDYLIRY